MGFPWVISILSGGFATSSLIIKPTTYREKLDKNATATRWAEQNPSPTPKPLPTETPRPTQTPIILVVTATPDLSRPTLTATPTSTALPTSTPTQQLQSDQGTNSPFKLTSSTFLKLNVALKHRPDGLTLSPEIPKGQPVALFGKARGAGNVWWYRVMWTSEAGESFAGWVNSNNTDFPEDKLSELRAPPPCAVYLANLPENKTWTNLTERNIVLLADLYRIKPRGLFPDGTLIPVINQVKLDKASRIFHSTSGQFLLRGTALNLGKVVKSVEISLFLDARSAELTGLFVAIFAVPDGCQFGDL